MRMLKTQVDRRRGFTLIELVIVILILLSLGALVVVNLIPTKEKADAQLQLVQFDQIDAAMKLFKLHMHRYPNEEEGLAALTRKDAIQNEEEAAKWLGPYLEASVMKDKWSHDIIYHFPGQLRGEQYYDLISIGPDGQEGTGDDITNHDRTKSADGEFEQPEDSFAPPVTDSGGDAGSGSSSP